jgi:regulatory protein YycH of two-component signal transduction system YycFG
VKVNYKNIVSYLLLLVYLVNTIVNQLPALNKVQEDITFKRICFKKQDQNNFSLSTHHYDNKLEYSKTTKAKQERKLIQFCSSKDIHLSQVSIFHVIHSESLKHSTFFKCMELSNPCCIDPPPPSCADFA